MSWDSKRYLQRLHIIFWLDSPLLAQLANGFINSFETFVLHPLLHINGTTSGENSMQIGGLK